MIGLVLVTHGRLAAEFVAALEHVVGPQERVRAVCIGADDDIEEAARKMGEAQVRRLPVIDESENLVGIVSLGDLARETDDESAHQALEGVSEQTSQHQQ